MKAMIIDNKLKAINLTDGGKSYRIVAKKMVDGHTQIMNILKKKILDDFDNKNLSCQCNLTAQIDQCRIIYRYNNLVTLLVGGYGANFNNSSAILWWSALLVEETGVPEENH